MTIKSVLFDAAGTLIKTAKPVGESYSAIAETHGVQVAPGELAARFRTCFDRASPLAFPGVGAGAIRGMERNWWKELVRDVFSPFGAFAHFDACFDELFGYFARADSWKLYPEAVETLLSLRQRGLKLAVVSNFDSRLHNILDGLGAASWFDGVFVSSTVGYAKPDRRIFEFVLKAQRLTATNVLHVGDSITNDIAGAANAGVKGILVDRKGSHNSDGIPRVVNLREILAHLE
ncbi:MAG: HAD-IA family hydrolase [Deltaproteobacteria bacterium]|nr:HAD-IA family hydrolase [Deltaproteobacteria bacterium]